MEKQRAAEQAQSELAKANKPAPATTTPAGSPSTPAAPGAAPSVNQPTTTAIVSRDAAISGSPRIKIETPRLAGSVSLKGARIDDLSLVRYRDTVDPKSPAIVLFSPSGTSEAYYAEFGWVSPSGSSVKIPDQNTVWQQDGGGNLTPDHPVALKWDNGEGVTFRRTIAVDDHYLFSIKDEVVNSGSAPVTLYPFALISRHGTPQVSGYYILHEGLVGYLGDQGLQEYSYKKIAESKSVNFKVTNGWLGITDKYWASALLPETSAALQARFSSQLLGTTQTYQTDYLENPQTIAPGSTGGTSTRLLAGAKEATTIPGTKPSDSIIFNAAEYWPTSALAPASPRELRRMSPIITWSILAWT